MKSKKRVQIGSSTFFKEKEQRPSARVITAKKTLDTLAKSHQRQVCRKKNPEVK